MSRADKYRGLLAKFYDADHRWRDYAGQARFLKRLLSGKRGARVLDLACGTGEHAVRLARAGFRVTGLDLSKEFLRIARGKAKGLRDARFVRTDAFHLAGRREFRGKFDAACLLGWSLSIEAVWQQFPSILKSAFWALKPGGVFVFDASVGLHFNPVPRGALRYRLSDGTRAELRIAWRPGRPGTRDYEYDWAIVLPGKGAPLRLVARERLRVQKPEAILKAVRRSGGWKEVRAFCGRDHDLLVILRKREEN